MCQWKTNKHVYADHSIYGNGTLFYGANQAKMRGVTDYVGSLRVEIMRDGIEEYQMLKMLEGYLGEKEAKAVVGQVSTNIVRYLSLPGFNRSAWDSEMDEYDIMAAVRKNLGNTLEAAVAEGQCDHSYDDGVVVSDAGCITTGSILYTCVDCGAQYDEVIPTKHSVGDCYVKVSGTAATCENDGAEVYQCTDCGNKKTVYTKAYHNDTSGFIYESNGDKAHVYYCPACNEKLGSAEHNFFTVSTATCTEAGEFVDECSLCKATVSTGTVAEAKGHNLVTKTVEPTCTEDGYSGAVCKNCDYSEAEVIPATGHELVDVALDATCTEEGYKGTECTKCDYSDITVLPVIDHSYVDGKCENCGAEDPDYSGDAEYTLGDMDGDSKINAKDANLLKRIVSGSLTPTDIQRKTGDINGDGAVNAIDANLITRLAAGAN